MRLNTVYPRRGEPFTIKDYPPAIQKLIRKRLLPIEELIHALPKHFSFFSTFAMSQARGFLRNLSLRDDWQEVTFYGALVVEPYRFFQHPKVKIISAYLSPVDRFIAHKMKKTVSHMPRQFVQFGDLILKDGIIDYLVHTVPPPDRDGYVNLGVNCEILYESIKKYSKNERVKIIFEINSHMPWVMGHKDFGYNKVHLSQIDYLYEMHEPLPQVPPIPASEVQKKIAEHVLPFIEDGDTLQLGIGGIPNSIAKHLTSHRDLKIHSEMLTDGMVDLMRAGAINSKGKAYMDGLIVGAFAGGTDKLYDWLDRNSEIVLLPIKEINAPHLIGQNKRMKSVNSALMIDLHGQVCSDAVGFHQISGVGGQLEFVMGAQLSEGGRSILCIKSIRKVNGKVRSNIVLNLPPGSAIAVPRYYADVIVTEYGVAEIRDLDTIERARALVGIAHPTFRKQLTRQAAKVGLWERRPGFESFGQRALFNNLDYVRSLRAKVQARPSARLKIILDEVKRFITSPDSIAKIKKFYFENRA